MKPGKPNLIYTLMQPPRLLSRLQRYVLVTCRFRDRRLRWKMELAAKFASLIAADRISSARSMMNVSFGFRSRATSAWYVPRIPLHPTRKQSQICSKQMDIM